MRNYLSQFKMWALIALLVIGIVPLSADNVMIWNNPVATTGAEPFNAAVDADGNLYLVGLIHNNGVFNFGNGVKLNVTTGSCGVMVKYAPSGKVLWAHQGPPGSWYFGVAVSPKGQVAVAAEVTGSKVYALSKKVSIQGGVPQGRSQAVIVFDSKSNPVWARSVEAPKSTGGTGLAVAFGPDESLYFAGEHFGRSAFGPDLIVEIQRSPGYTMKGALSLFLVKYDARGTPLWARSVRALDSDVDASRIKALAVDAMGDVWAAGNVYGDSTINFDLGGPEFKGLDPDMSSHKTYSQYQTFFIAKFDPNGRNYWIRENKSGLLLGQPGTLKSPATDPSLAPGVELSSFPNGGDAVYYYSGISGPKGSVYAYGMDYEKGAHTLAPGLSFTSTGNYNWRVFQFRPEGMTKSPKLTTTRTPRTLINLSTAAAGELWIDNAFYDKLRNGGTRLLELSPDQTHKLEMRYPKGEIETQTFDPSYPQTELVFQKVPPTPTQEKIARQELETLKVVSAQGVKTSVQNMKSFSKFPGVWSGDQQLFVASQTGGSLILELPISKNGNYVIRLVATKAPDFGIIQIKFGPNVWATLDLYSPEVITTDPIDIGPIGMFAGNQQMEFLVIGKNSSSTNTLFGLDYFQLIPERF